MLQGAKKGINHSIHKQAARERGICSLCCLRHVHLLGKTKEQDFVLAASLSMTDGTQHVVDGDLGWNTRAPWQPLLLWGLLQA